jgi:hypothetical protein
MLGNLMKKTAIATTLFAGLALTACTTTEKVNVMQLSDHAMTCTQLNDEIARLTIAKANASDKSMNGTNTAAALDSSNTERLATERRTHLRTYYSEKQCDSPANANLTIQVPSFLLEPIATGE